MAYHTFCAAVMCGQFHLSMDDEDLDKNHVESDDYYAWLGLSKSVSVSFWILYYNFVFCFSWSFFLSKRAE